MINGLSYGGNSLAYPRRTVRADRTVIHMKDGTPEWFETADVKKMVCMGLVRVECNCGGSIHHEE